MVKELRSEDVDVGELSPTNPPSTDSSKKTVIVKS